MLISVIYIYIYWPFELISFTNKSSNWVLVLFFGEKKKHFSFYVSVFFFFFFSFFFAVKWLHVKKKIIKNIIIIVINFISIIILVSVSFINILWLSRCYIIVTASITLLHQLQALLFTNKIMIKYNSKML